jgi:THO complex subunit 4
MQGISANSHVSCNSCNRVLGFITTKAALAGFIYCHECQSQGKLHPLDAFRRYWDPEIFLPPFPDFSLEGSDGGMVRAHKAVLAGKCKVFKAMLTAGMAECSLDRVKILDMTAQELQALVDFIYKGMVSQRSLEKHAVALYKASHKYDLPSLTKLSERFLQSNVFRDIPGVIEVAVTHESKTLQKAVLPYIFDEGFVQSNSPSFVVKTLREAFMFDGYEEYRQEHDKEIPWLMEKAIQRIACQIILEDLEGARQTDPTQGTGDIVFARREDAETAVQQHNNVQLDGKLFKPEIVETNLTVPAQPRNWTVGNAIRAAERGRGRSFLKGSRGSRRRKSRLGQRGEYKTGEDLDAEIETYHAETMQTN